MGDSSDVTGTSSEPDVESPACATHSNTDNAAPSSPTNDQVHPTTNSTPTQDSSSPVPSRQLQTTNHKKNSSRFNLFHRNSKNTVLDADGRDAYTAELLRAKTQRNVALSGQAALSRRNLRVQFQQESGSSSPSKSFRRASDNSALSDASASAGNKNPEERRQRVVRSIALLQDYLSTRNLVNESANSNDSGGVVEGEAVIPYGSAANTTAYDTSQHGSMHVTQRRTNNIEDVLNSDLLQVLQEMGGSVMSLDESGDGLHHGLDNLDDPTNTHHHAPGHLCHDAHDEHGHDHGGRIPFYSYPRQRQKWGEAQVLPHINWGDLFFDLFYVAAAYNMGTLLMSTLTPELFPRGIVYFIGVFGPLFTAWESKLVFEARYSVGDYAHQLLEIIRVFFLSFSILHIKSIDLMADPKSAESLGFVSGLFLESLIRVFLKLELICVGQGDREAITNHSKRKALVVYIPQSLLYMTATIIAGVQFLNENNGSGAGDSNSSYGSKGEADKGVYGYDDGGKRSLAAAEDGYGSNDGGWSIADLPIAICLLTYVYTILYHITKGFLLPRVGDFRKSNVPSNIDFLIHRYGEWCMLMLGESVLSLLIVDTTESAMYYTVAVLGVLTVILLQAVKFESEPTHAEGHALWRNLTYGMLYDLLIQVLSMGLIAFGVSYKVMLKTIHKQNEKKAGYADYGADSSYGSVDKSDSYGDSASYNETSYESDVYSGLDSTAYPDQSHRFLATSVAATDKASAALFCGSLTLVLIAIELMTNTHRGTHDNYRHFFHPSQWNEDPQRGKLSFALFLFKLALIVFTATLSQWLTDPNYVAVAGFCIVLAFCFTRIIWWNYIHNTGKSDSKNH